jgi:hypothetical protein
MTTQEPSKEQEKVKAILRHVDLIHKSSFRMNNAIVELMARLRTEDKLDLHTLSFMKAECKQMFILVDGLQKELKRVKA